MRLDYVVEAPGRWTAVARPVAEGVVVAFETDTGFDDAQVQAHVVSALARGLPLAPSGLNLARPVHVYANGPSVVNAPLRSPSLALNGAYRLFGDGPDLWAAVDARACVADHVAEPKPRTRHLVASKCHPAVFDRLAGQQVFLWHVGDGGAQALPDGSHVIAPGVSVTGTVLGLVYSLGFREAHIQGWDCCYSDDGRDHAVAQDHDRSCDIEVRVGARLYRTTQTWAAEVRAGLRYMELVPGLKVHVHGDGMMAAAMRLLAARGGLAQVRFLPLLAAPNPHPRPLPLLPAGEAGEREFVNVFCALDYMLAGAPSPMS
ncbi:hypothetical protein [Asticcacaulis sp. AC402]|uniref:hypothetical protein n=1 Tax=Asticcacaulis sp. AC402 TaxID=1282361 RepID=UPI0003C402FD|nr:hypothetical protein [Asticcacaulis sp. AC402]ESQ73480.1 hypothetical protein ABAC402_19075 [Asticcacaulis sp. AC402]